MFAPAEAYSTSGSKSERNSNSGCVATAFATAEYVTLRSPTTAEHSWEARAKPARNTSTALPASAVASADIARDSASTLTTRRVMAGFTISSSNMAAGKCPTAECGSAPGTWPSASAWDRGDPLARERGEGPFPGGCAATSVVAAAPAVLAPVVAAVLALVPAEVGWDAVCAAAGAACCEGTEAVDPAWWAGADCAFRGTASWSLGTG